MNTTYKTLALGGAQLLALGVMPGDATLLQPQYAENHNPNAVHQMDEAQLRSVEASHLEVYAGCKWGKAAFDPVQVAAEPVSIDVHAIFAQMIRA
jgi:hypothetical protein